MLKKLSLVAVSILALSACQDQAAGDGSGDARTELRIVGSSTVFPFAKLVAETYQSSAEGIKAPVLESTGTGGGIENFCKGIGANTPDIANASRRMKLEEFEKCQSNGVTDIIEIQVGIDGIAFAQSTTGPEFKLSSADIYAALAANPFGKPQTAKNWSDINPAYPNVAISVYGPPSTSGTRDAFEELIMEAGCKTDPTTKALKDSDEDAYDAICTEVRNDTAFKEQGENDNLIVGKLTANPDSLGIFGYSYMEENADKVRGVAIDGAAPTYDSIAGGSYPGARPLFIYVKKQHIGKIPGIKEFITEFYEAGVAGSYLAKIGLIAAPEAMRAKAKAAVDELAIISADDLK